MPEGRRARTSASTASSPASPSTATALDRRVGDEFRTGIPDYGTRRATVLLTIVDGRVAATDTHSPHGLGAAQPGSTPPDCAAASFANQGEVLRSEGDFIVDDAAPTAGARE